MTDRNHVRRWCWTPETHTASAKPSGSSAPAPGARRSIASDLVLAALNELPWEPTPLGRRALIDRLVRRAHRDGGHR